MQGVPKAHEELLKHLLVSRARDSCKKSSE
jgi:hypothetical protein